MFHMVVFPPFLQASPREGYHCRLTDTLFETLPWRLVVESRRRMFGGVRHGGARE